MLIGVVGCMIGCTTPYAIDRKRDAADIFTAAVGLGGGVKARVGPLRTGLVADIGLAGLRSGTLFVAQLPYWAPMDFNVLGSGDEIFEGNLGDKTVTDRYKASLINKLYKLHIVFHDHWHGNDTHA